MTISVSVTPPTVPVRAAATGSLSFNARTSLVIFLSLFIVGWFSLAASNLVSAWTLRNSAQAMRSNSEIGDLFLSAAGALATERGIVSAALANSMPANSRVREHISQLRERSGLALRSALDRVSVTAAFLGKDVILGRMIKHAAALELLRGEIDWQLSKPASERDTAVIKRWMPMVTDLIISSQTMRVAAQVVPSAALARTQLLLNLKQATWVMSEYAGRERATVAELIGHEAQIDPATLVKLAEYRGRLEQAWTELEAYEAREFADPLVLVLVSTRN